MSSKDPGERSSRRSTVHAASGAVATSQPLAANAGLEILANDGNAFDAAVAAAATLNVVEPTGTGIGGDVFALYRTPDDDVGAMRSCGGAPGEATVDRIREATGAEEMPFRGPHTVTVPGTARGWETLIDAHGTESLATVLAPAIEYAREGYPASPVIAAEWQEWEDIFTEPNARRAFLPAPAAGDVVRLPALADSLETIATSGADPVYEGAIADAIVGEVRENGGFLSRADLADHEAEFVDPIARSYQGATVHQLPPNNQGMIVLEALGIAEEIGATRASPNSVERTHRLVESMRLAFIDGHDHISDPAYVDVPPLTGDAWVSDRADRVTRRAGPHASMSPPSERHERSDTVLVTTADREGNVVTLINSRFHGFGSGLVAGETGIALQNRGASFSLDPSDPNCLKPGKRPFHTLIPSIVQFGAEDWAAFGVMGGTMQPQGQLQILASIVGDDADPQRALDAPRWRYRSDGRLAVEARMDERLQTALVQRGHDVIVRPPTDFGGAQFVRHRGDHIVAASEPRKDGHACGR